MRLIYGLKSLVEQAGQIGEDIVGSLIAGIQKAGTGGTLLDVNVSPAGKNVSASSGSGTSGNISKTEIAPAQKKELDKVTVGAVEEPSEIAEVQKLIKRVRRIRNLCRMQRKRNIQIVAVYCKKIRQECE